MKICVLVKEVPAAGGARRIRADTGRLDRSGATTINPWDAYALETAVRLREARATAVERIVALSMGPPSAERVLQRALSLGADHGLLLSDPALAGSCVLATGYALARVLERESPGLVLAGQQSDDGQCYSMAAIVAEHLGLPSLTQVSAIDVGDGVLRCERQAEYGYDTVELDLPAVVSVSEAINEPRYPSLSAVMAAREQPVERVTLSAAGIDASRVGQRGSGTAVLGLRDPAPRVAGEIIEDGDTAATVERIVDWMRERRLVG